MATVSRQQQEEEPEEKEIRTKIDEIDMLLDQLQKRNRDLVEAQNTLEEGKKVREILSTFEKFKHLARSCVPLDRFFAERKGR
jgi:hypothetical protein